MGKIVSVLGELLKYPALLDIFTLEFNIKDSLSVSGDFEKIEFLAYVRNGKGEIESVQMTDPVFSLSRSFYEYRSDPVRK